MQAKRVTTAALLVTCSVFTLLIAHDSPSSSSEVSTHFGHVDFPNSCKPVAQTDLINGLALLHSFQYQQSEGAFRDAAIQDSTCAIAKWGQAMALYHQLWDFPNRHTLHEGWERIDEAQRLNAPTPRERAYIAAASALFQEDAKLSHTQRTEAYSTALSRLHAESPNDVEASAFYALSLVALADQDVDVMDNRRKAIAMLEPLFQKHPDNPGVAHYLIHAADRPELASQGLAAARAYARIAPDSSHALHMPSHIFTRLGLWQESITSNVAATAAAAHATEMHQSESHYQTHAMDFLDYAYLQTGQEAKARALSNDEMSVPGSDQGERADHKASVDARNAMELHHWKEAATLPVPERKRDQDTTYWARTIGAARGGDVIAARSECKKLEEAVARREGESRSTGYNVSDEKAVDLSEAEAWLAWAEGDSALALKTLTSTADREDAKGVDSTSIPAREMLGDMLLEAKKPTEALKAYKIALKESPNRFDSLYGAAQAAEAAGDTHSALQYFSKLVQISDPNADRPELAEAKQRSGNAK